MDGKVFQGEFKASSNGNKELGLTEVRLISDSSRRRVRAALSEVIPKVTFDRVAVAAITGFGFATDKEYQATIDSIPELGEFEQWEDDDADHLKEPVADFEIAAPSSGWAVEDMFAQNKNVKSDFLEDLSQYTNVEVGHQSREALKKATQIAKEITKNVRSRHHEQLENDDEERDLDKETVFKSTALHEEASVPAASQEEAGVPAASQEEAGKTADFQEEAGKTADSQEETGDTMDSQEEVGETAVSQEEADKTVIPQEEAAVPQEEAAEAEGSQEEAAVSQEEGAGTSSPSSPTSCFRFDANAKPFRPSPPSSFDANAKPFRPSLPIRQPIPMLYPHETLWPQMPPPPVAPPVMVMYVDIVTGMPVSVMPGSQIPMYPRYM
uniref:LsmAD domain-containing protein n=1 Tax=Steinernema glaseri TaxID=37863 RepID=A0A1I8AN10_9BILA